MEKPSLKSLLQFTSLPFSCEEAPLWQHSWGDIGIILPLPTCKCNAIKERLHSACSERRWVFFTFIHFFKNGKNCATDILRTDECDWGWLVAKSEAMSERTERDAWNGDWLCGERAQFDCFSECVSGSCGCYERLPLTWTFFNKYFKESFFFFLIFASFSLLFKYVDQVQKYQNVVECCDEYLYCLYYLIWMLYGVCFHVLELICKCVLDVDDTCWRLWGTRVIVWERGVVCPRIPSSSCCLWGVKKHVKWREFSNKVHLNRCIVEYYLSRFCQIKKHLIRFTYLGTLGSAGRGLRLNPDWSLFWRTKTEVPTLSVCGLLRHDMG